MSFLQRLKTGLPLKRKLLLPLLLAFFLGVLPLGLSSIYPQETITTSSNNLEQMLPLYPLNSEIPLNLISNSNNPIENLKMILEQQKKLLQEALTKYETLKLSFQKQTEDYQNLQSIANSLQSKLAQVDSSLQSLKNELENSKNISAELQKSYNNTLQELQALKIEYQQTLSLLEDYKNKLIATADELKNLKLLLDNSQQIVQNLTKQLEQSQQDLQASQAQVVTLETSLQSSSNSLTSALKNLDESKRLVDELTLKLTKASERVTNLETVVIPQLKFELNKAFWKGFGWGSGSTTLLFVILTAVLSYYKIIHLGAF